MSKNDRCCGVSLSVYRQFLSAIFCCIGSLSLGLSLGWSAPAFVKIKNGEAPFELTIYEQSIVVGALNIGLMIGTYPAGYLMDRIGRKTTLLYASSFSLINWILIAFASSELYLYVARLFAGLWAGAISTLVPIYVTECSETKIRGSTTTQHLVFMSAGILLGYIIGPQVGYMDFALICGAFTVFFAIVFSFPPESPYFLTMKGRTEEARAALVWLRATDDVDNELKSIEAFIADGTKGRCSYKDLVKNPLYRRPFFICLVLWFCQKFTGFYTLIAYQTVILPKKLGVLTSDNCTQIVGVIILTSVFIASRLMDATGRKVLLTVSHVGIAVFMGIVGALYALNDTGYIRIEDYSYLLVFSFVAYVFSFSIGIGPIASLYTGEVLPQAAKGTAGSVILSLSSIASAGNTFAFAATANWIGMHWNFFFYSALSVASLVFVHLCLTETRGRTFQDIQSNLSVKKKPEMTAIEK
ncbi:unnamed protein product [Bemisia tabaci]|uniref:Major facilitator superfamily (MFS) profile domain-containing protein n=1 Tax=Bemisia tabaci TaxID=7038 RepID=A0A9P0G547_BEMTA|nr:unnamed protein product [Bemisia tabaci]